MNTKDQTHPAEVEVIWHNEVTAQRGIAACRAALAEASRGLCPHKVRWRDCHQHDGHVIAGEVITEETG